MAFLPAFLPSSTGIEVVMGLPGDPQEAQTRGIPKNIIPHEPVRDEHGRHECDEKTLKPLFRSFKAGPYTTPTAQQAIYEDIRQQVLDKTGKELTDEQSLKLKCHIVDVVLRTVHWYRSSEYQRMIRLYGKEITNSTPRVNIKCCEEWLEELRTASGAASTKLQVHKRKRQVNVGQ